MILDRTVQFFLEMDALSSISLLLIPSLKWFFKDFDKAVAKVPGFIVTSVSALPERLFLCHFEKFTLLSLGRTVKPTTMYLKGRRNYFFFSPNFILFWKDTEGL